MFQPLTSQRASLFPGLVTFILRTSWHSLTPSFLGSCLQEGHLQPQRAASPKGGTSPFKTVFYLDHFRCPHFICHSKRLCGLWWTMSKKGVKRLHALRSVSCGISTKKKRNKFLWGWHLQSAVPVKTVKMSYAWNMVRNIIIIYETYSDTNGCGSSCGR